MNQMQVARQQALQLIRQAWEMAAASSALPDAIPLEPTVTPSADPAFGDLTSPLCLAAAGSTGLSPRSLADVLVRRMDLKGSAFTAVESPGPGYLNFRLSDRWLADTLAAMVQAGPRCGVSREFAGQTVALRLTGDGSWATALRCRTLARVLANLWALCGATVEDGMHNNYVNCKEIAVASCRLTDRGQPILCEDHLPPAAADALRYLLSVCPESPVAVDLELALREDGTSPFYRVRYTCRRLGQVLARLPDQTDPSPAILNEELSTLRGSTERRLALALVRYDDVVLSAARSSDPGVLTAYLATLADLLWDLYRTSLHDCQGHPPVTAHLALAKCGRTVLANGLGLLGIES